MEEENSFPIVPISTIELQLIDSALFVYLFIAQRMQRPSSEDNAMLLAIKNLRQRISTVEVPEGGEQPFLITEDDLAVILHALTAFMNSITLLIPPSQERDEAIMVYKSLRSSLSTIFSERSTPSNGE